MRPNCRLKRFWPLVCLVVGCDYGEWTARYKDSLAIEDYREKERQLLGAMAGGLDSLGLALRLPKQASSEPSATPVLGTAITYRTDPELAKRTNIATPITVVVFVSRKTKDTELLDTEQLAQQALAARNDWAGADLQVDQGLTLEQASIPIGPETRRKRDALRVQRATLKQFASSAPAGGQQTSVEYVWQLYFLEDSAEAPTARAMIGYGVRQSDYAEKFADAIQMSVAGASFFTPEGSQPAEDSAGKDAAEPEGKDDSKSKAAKGAAPAKTRRGD